MADLARSVPIEELIALFEASPSISDGDLYHHYERLLVSGSAEGVAVGFFAAAGRIGARRAHLIEALLREPLGALTCLGYESAEEVFAYVRYVFQAQWLEGIWPGSYADYRRNAGLEGRRWLVEELPQHTALIQQLLDEELARNMEE